MEPFLLVCSCFDAYWLQMVERNVGFVTICHVGGMADMRCDAYISIRPGPKAKCLKSRQLDPLWSTYRDKAQPLTDELSLIVFLQAVGVPLNAEALKKLVTQDLA